MFGGWGEEEEKKKGEGGHVYIDIPILGLLHFHFNIRSTDLCWSELEMVNSYSSVQRSKKKSKTDRIIDNYKASRVLKINTFNTEPELNWCWHRNLVMQVPLLQMDFLKRPSTQ